MMFEKNVIIDKTTNYDNSIRTFAGPYGITIGKYCAIGSNLTLMGVNHDYNYPALQYIFYHNKFNIDHPGVSNQTKEYSKGKITIGNDIWIGNNVSIMPGVTIGDGSIIGLGSIVTKDIEPYSVCVGVPCKKIKSRYSKEIIKYLLELKWWNWDDNKIKNNAKFFSTNLNNILLDDLKQIIQ